MALFHLNVSSIGKSSGSSACASAAYRSCSEITQTITDPQTGIEVSYTHDFSNKKGLAFSEVFAPEGLDSWCSNREQLWNKVEARETHVKGRYARDIKLALQTEFSLEQNIKILSEYVKETFVKDGIIADVNIHMDDLNNPHAHIMLTTRKLEMNDNDEWVFGNKNRTLDSKGWLVNIRNNWAEINNKHFMIHGIDKSITHESYESRGLGFIKSTIHEGAAKHTENKDVVLERPEYNRDIVSQNLQYIKSNPSEVIQALAQNASNSHGAFGRVDLFKAIDVLLNEIATRGNEAQVLVDEAKASLLNKCDEIFHEVDSYDLALNLGHNGHILGYSIDKNYTRNNEFDSNSLNNKSNKFHLDSAPEIHENVVAIIERFFSRNEKVININDELKYIKDNSADLIEKISSKTAVFNKSHLIKALDNHFNNILLEGANNSANNVDHELLSSTKAKIAKEYDSLLSGLINSKEIVKLIDKDIGGKEVYTTKGQLSLEKEFISNIESLIESNKHSLNLPELSQEKLLIPKQITNGISKGLKSILTPEASSWVEKTFSSLIGSPKKVTLSNEQSNAVLSLVNGKDLVCLSGMPGTGKSTVMAKLVEEYSSHGYEVVGGAISAVASLNLATEANVKAYTLAKWKHDWNFREHLERSFQEVRYLLPKLTSKNVMIVDEMSMVDLKMFNYITSKVVEAGAKLIVLGDNNQFSAIGIGGASERIVEKAENVVLTELFRQRATLDKEITRKLSSYKVDEAVTLLDEKGGIKICNSPGLTRSELINNYMNEVHQVNNNTDKTSGASKNETRVIIAYRNNEVKALNLEIRNRMLNSGLLLSKNHKEGGQKFRGHNSTLKIALNEQLVFTKNKSSLGVLNGQIGRVIKIIDSTRFKVELLDGGNKKSRTILIDNVKFSSFDYGYAITSYKSQGKTYDHSYLLLDASVGYESFNVMATRHRISSAFYIDRGILNDIISRKFDSDKDISHQRDNLVGNERAALFELLSRRSANVLAHDYKDYEQKPEVIQIRAYLESRDKAAGIYRQLLQWQEKGIYQGQKLELWDNKKLWEEFNFFREERSQHAQELVEGYSSYKKYINSSIINYATLLKHADAATIEFDYSTVRAIEGQQDSSKREDRYKSHKESYNELILHQESYIKNPNQNMSEKLLGKAEELLTIQQEHRCNLARLSSQIKSAENTKWELESQKQANIYYREDIKHFLNQTYKQGAKAAFENWQQLKQSMGLKNALLHIKDNPESLGSLAGVGWSDKIAVSEARSRAVFNLTSLVGRIDSYEKSITNEHELSVAINHKAIVELKTFNERYNQLEEANNPLNHLQEKHLYELQEHKADLHTWLKGNTKEVRAAIVSNKSEVDELSKSKAINNKQNNIQPELTYSEIHDKLSANVVELSKQLLPSISNKKIEIDKHSIKCGSLNIALGGNKTGLWYRFSRVDEKGDLFDLIRVSKGLSNKQDAISWGKSYLGLDQNSHSLDKNQSNKMVNKEANSAEISIVQEVKTIRPIRPSLKVLSPVPHEAEALKPEMLFYKQLQNTEGNNKIIDGVYAYKNIKNELCGYVVRIKDITNDTKVTLPVVYTENNHGIKSWRSKGLGDDRCLYNEHLLKDSHKPVLIVEGEKTADVAQSLYPEFDVITWSGGANGFSKSNWNVLEGKQVTIWPDNDKAGIDAAHKIQTLLDKQNITQAKVIDLSKIDYLPEKWDLADAVPEKVRQHQITGSLFRAKGIESNIRIEKTSVDYIEFRQQDLNTELNSKDMSSLSNYIKENKENKIKLHYENIFLKEKLLTKNILSVSDECTISSEASKLVDNHIKTLKLAPNSTLENISSCIHHDLALLHQDVPKVILIEATKEAIKHVEQVIGEHNIVQQTNELSKHVNNSASKLSNTLTHADIPILSLSLASNIINHHRDNDYHSSESINTSNHHQDHQQQMHLQQSINMAKSSFKLQVENESMHFEQHQQQNQIMQRQKSLQSEIA